jgi:2-polyprenyl-6-methoxyphenol hydroxylase-like FAD-dependent oxidoreductase
MRRNTQWRAPHEWVIEPMHGQTLVRSVGAMRGDGVQVLVVGAGVAGLASARALHRWGAAVEVVERSATATTDGTGIYLPGNAVRALDRLGLRTEVVDRAVRIERQRLADHRGRLLAEVRVDDVWRGVGPCLALHRSALHQVLLAGAADVPIRWGQSPRTIDVERGTVVFDDGRTGRYDLVLGADGLHSTVRRLTFGAAQPRPVGQYARRFVVPYANAEPVWSVLLGRGTSVLSIPIGDAHLYCYCDGPPGDPQPPLRELLAGYGEPVPTVLDALDRADGQRGTHAGPIEEIVLDRWYRGAVLLIGDAAHATSPNMAQGAAMALEDALVLAESLATADSIPAALTAYERRRRPRTDWVLSQTHRRDRTRSIPTVVRNQVAKHLWQRIYRANYRPLLERP